MADLKKLKKELKPYKNTLVIEVCNAIVRLVDVIDGEEDYYWVYDTENDGIHRSSCVMGWTPLKGFISDKKYKRMVSVWNLNNVEKAI